MKRNKKRYGRLLMAGGLILLLGAAALSGYNIWDERRAAEAADQALAVLEQLPPAAPLVAEDPGEQILPDYVVAPEIEMPETEVNEQDYIGVLSIPGLALEIPVISQWSYPNLKLSPCRYKGSVYLDNMIVAGHNYRTHFGGLKDLRAGDGLSFTDVEGNVFSYQVVELEQLAGTAVEEMEAGDWDLTLFTCTPGGQSRVTVRCERADTTP